MHFKTYLAKISAEFNNHQHVSKEENATQNSFGFIKFIDSELQPGPETSDED